MWGWFAYTALRHGYTERVESRFLECGEAAEADYLVTGKIRHFPQIYKRIKIVTGRRFLDILADADGK